MREAMRGPPNAALAASEAVEKSVLSGKMPKKGTSGAKQASEKGTGRVDFDYWL